MQQQGGWQKKEGKGKAFTENIFLNMSVLKNTGILMIDFAQWDFCVQCTLRGFALQNSFILLCAKSARPYAVA